MVEQTVIAIIATCIASFVIYLFKSSVILRYSLDVLDRASSGKEFPLYECIGGIVVPIGQPAGQHNDMDNVPNGLYERALKMALLKAAEGMPPSFDLKVMGKRDVYWIHAGREGRVHALSFFRRPRLFALSRRD